MDSRIKESPLDATPPWKVPVSRWRKLELFSSSRQRSAGPEAAAWFTAKRILQRLKEEAKLAQPSTSRKKAAAAKRGNAVESLGQLVNRLSGDAAPTTQNTREKRRTNRAAKGSTVGKPLPQLALRANKAKGKQPKDDPGDDSDSSAESSSPGSSESSEASESTTGEHSSTGE